MTERFYIVATALGALSLLAVLATVIVCIYFDRSMRVQARGQTQSGTSIEAELEVTGRGDGTREANTPRQTHLRAVIPLARQAVTSAVQSRRFDMPISLSRPQRRRYTPR